MYKVLFDYGSSGRSFLGDDNEGAVFETVDEAVKAAFDFRSTSTFIIVKVVEWNAEEAQNNLNKVENK